MSTNANPSEQSIDRDLESVLDELFEIPSDMHSVQRSPDFLSALSDVAKDERAQATDPAIRTLSDQPKPPSAAMTKEDQMIVSPLQAEIERQRKYLGELPNDFLFPLFNTKHALESMRRSGYRDTAAAAREIVDNAIEAKASRIDVIFQRPRNPREYERRDSVAAVAFIDNGSGMLPVMARYALSWGAGTHFDEPGTIGKFGFGLPNASINQTTRVEVYTKTADVRTVSMAYLDVTNFKEHGVQSIAPAVEAELPDFVQDHLKANGLTFEHGSVVVWRAPDRLTYRMAAPLREHLVDDFGVVYRYMLGDVDLYVEKVKVEPVDPLFLTPGARYYVPEEDGGAILSYEALIPVRYYRDPDTGGRHLAKIEDASQLNPEDPNLLATGAIGVRISRFPKGFAEHTKGKATSDAHRRFEIRKSRRGMSFVRAGREIETLDAFPRSARDQASGLGDWPLLQAYAYHWGIEVRFGAELDEVFGIANDKQTVRPMEDFWRVLTKEEIDAKLRAENAWQMTARKKETPRVDASDQPTEAEKAAAMAERIKGTVIKVPEREQKNVNQQFEDEARRRVGVTAATVEEAKKAIETEAKKRPYRIEFFDDANGPFFVPAWDPGSVVVARVNRAHPFYTTLYGELVRLGASQARNAVDVLLLALARAELRTEDEVAKLWYEEQRKVEWSSFLGNALRVLSQTLRAGEAEEDVVAEATDAAPGAEAAA